MQTKLPIELSLRHVGYVDVFFLIPGEKMLKIVEKRVHLGILTGAHTEKL